MTAQDVLGNKIAWRCEGRSWKGQRGGKTGEEATVDEADAEETVVGVGRRQKGELG